MTESASGEAPIQSSWAVRAAAGEPFAVVRVRNLQAIVLAGQDAWGRENKVQPLLVSAEVSFSRPFETASSTDQVSADTVHYGTLSKTILASLEYYSPQNFDAAAAETGGPTASSLRDVLERIWLALTGLRVDGHKSAGAEEKGKGKPRPFLDLSKLRSLTVSVCLPKATLLGDEVGLTATSVFSGPRPDMFGIALHLKNLRIPTLIGVNSNERLSKQAVLASVEIDKYNWVPDTYTDLERVIVKVRAYPIPFLSIWGFFFFSFFW